MMIDRVHCAGSEWKQHWRWGRLQARPRLGAGWSTFSGFTAHAFLTPTWACRGRGSLPTCLSTMSIRHVTARLSNQCRNGALVLGVSGCWKLSRLQVIPQRVPVLTITASNDKFSATQLL